ncbi:hypothetical protein P4S72_26585 [Vibrio sp. PP-XX7]
MPTEHEQYTVYRQIAAAFDDQPVTIRSLDVGGDKPLAAYPMPAEDNPFLGYGVCDCVPAGSIVCDTDPGGAAGVSGTKQYSADDPHDCAS